MCKSLFYWLQFFDDRSGVNDRRTDNSPVQLVAPFGLHLSHVYLDAIAPDTLWHPIPGTFLAQCQSRLCMYGGGWFLLVVLLAAYDDVLPWFWIKAWHIHLYTNKLTVHRGGNFYNDQNIAAVAECMRLSYGAVILLLVPFPTKVKVLKVRSQI